MIVCSNCKSEKDDNEFYWGNKKKTKRQRWCKICFVKYTGRRSVLKKIKAIQYLGGKCIDCDRILSEENPYYLFDFHHLNPDLKEESFKDSRCWEWEKTKKELDKCILLCCLCHRHREYGSVGERLKPRIC